MKYTTNFDNNKAYIKLTDMADSWRAYMVRANRSKNKADDSEYRSNELAKYMVEYNSTLPNELIRVQSKEDPKIFNFVLSLSLARKIQAEYSLDEFAYDVINPDLWSIVPYFTKRYSKEGNPPDYNYPEGEYEKWIKYLDRKNFEPIEGGEVPKDFISPILAKISENKEKLVEAWVAETGLLPSESILCSQFTSDLTFKIWVMKK